MEAYQEASRWLERARAGATSATQYNNLTDTGGAAVGLNTLGSILPDDYSAWPLANKPSVESGSLSAEYEIADEDLGVGVAAYEFKKVTVAVKWTEKD